MRRDDKNSTVGRSENEILKMQDFQPNNFKSVKASRIAFLTLDHLRLVSSFFQL